MNLKKGIIAETLITLLSISLGILTNRILGAEQRGMLAAVMLYPAILSGVSSLQWDRQIISDIKSKIGTLNSIKSKIAATALTNGIVATVIVVVLSMVDNQISTNQVILISIYSIISIPCLLIQLYSNAYLIAKNQTIQVYYNRILLPFIMLCILLALILVTEIYYLHIVLLTMMSWVFTAIYVLISQKIRLIKVKENLKIIISELAQYRRHMAHLLDSISAHIDIIVVLKMLPMSFAGAYIFFKLIDLPYKIITFAFGNATAGQLVTEDKINIRYLGKYFFIITVLMSSVLIGPINYYETVIDLVVGPTYLEYSYLIKPITICCWTSAIGAHSYNLLTHAGAIDNLYIIQRYDFLLRTILMIIFTLVLGWIGLVLSIVISNCIKIALVFYQYAIYKRLKI